MLKKSLYSLPKLSAMFKNLVLFLAIIAAISYSSKVSAQCTPITGGLTVNITGSASGNPLTASAAITSNHSGQHISCGSALQGTVNDGEITVTASGGTQGAPDPYMYSIDNGSNYQTSNIFTGLTAGTYTITVKDDNNCTTTTAAVTLVAPPAIVAGTCTQVDDECQVNGGSITVDASGGTGTLNVTWMATANSPFTGTPGGSPAGNVNTPVPANYTGLSGNSTYNFKVTDANGCMAQ
jgi:hypothetical protein